MIKRRIAATLLIGLVLLQGCISQTTIADLVTTLGDDTAQLATLENNPTLAAKLKTDVAAASAAILAWKKGSPATEIIEVLNIVDDDLALFPVGQYAGLIELSIGTVEAILALFPASPSIQAHTRRALPMANPPKNSKEFQKRWLAIQLAEAAKH